MLLLFFFSAVFVIVVGWMIYYTIINQSKGTGCPENMPCNEKPRHCNRCRQLMPQCRCHKPCESC